MDINHYLTNNICIYCNAPLIKGYSPIYNNSVYVCSKHNPQFQFVIIDNNINTVECYVFKTYKGNNLYNIEYNIYFPDAFQKKCLIFSLHISNYITTEINLLEKSINDIDDLVKCLELFQ